MTPLPRRLPALTAALLILAGGCTAGADPLTADPVATTSVAVVDNAFEPTAIEVEAGQEVVWTWQGRSRHDVVGDGFDSGVMAEGTFSHTFDTPGTVEYVCTLHRGMRGVVHVVQT